MKKGILVMKRLPVARLLGAVLTTLTVSNASAGEAEVYDCLIEPNAKMEVGTREFGTLEAIHVKRGDLVKKGQVIAVLESGVETIAVELTRTRAGMNTAVEGKEAGLKFLQSQLTRLEDLYLKKICLISRER